MKVLTPLHRMFYEHLSIDELKLHVEALKLHHRAMEKLSVSFDGNEATHNKICNEIPRIANRIERYKKKIEKLEKMDGRIVGYQTIEELRIKNERY